VKQQMYRQGDVLLIPVVQRDMRLKSTAIEPVNGRIILAFGEATGHHHSLKANVGCLFERDQKRYLRMDVEAPLEHQEHAAILIPRGTYQVVIQREYSPEAIRNVQD
jgi:hypothetical protein